MDAARAGKIALGQAAADDPGDVPQEEIGKDLPANFAVRLGTLAILNFMKDRIKKQAASYGVPPGQLNTFITTELDSFAMRNNLKEAEFVAAISQSIGNPDAVRAQIPIFTGLFENLKDEFNKEQINREMTVAMQYCPEPVGDGLNGGRGQATVAWTNTGGTFQRAFTAMTEKWKATQSPQAQPFAPGIKGAPPIKASTEKRWSLAQMQEQPLAQPQQQGPIATGGYESLSQLREELISLGPTAETYNSILGMVGPEMEDDAKDALAKFFQGLASSLCVLYDMLVKAGMANPIDAEIVEKTMAQNPEAFQSNASMKTQTENNVIGELDKSRENKMAGLFLPCPKMQKLAATSSYPSYIMGGPSDNRYCPKIRKPVNTFICRFHCLDGLAIDDHQILCNEAIWRQAVMDKFSREYKDADGNWVGGYLNKRFEQHRDDAGHPYQLKPGTRHAPIHEDAWSLEKRMAESRKDEKGLYNFDQHKIAPGADCQQLGAKKPDSIAKIASTAGKVVTAESMFEETEDLGKQDPREFHKDEPSKKDLKDVEIKEPEKKKEEPPKETPFDKSASFCLHDIKNKQASSWSIKEAKYNKTVPEEKFKSCKEQVKKDSPEVNEYAVCTKSLGGQPASYHKKKDKEDKKADSQWGLTKAAWGIDPMMDNVDHGPRGKKCMACGKLLDLAAKACDNPLCGGTRFAPYTETDALAETHSIPGEELAIPASNNTEIKIANGVYRASWNGAYAYGEDEKDALAKLAQKMDGLNGLGKLEPEPIGKENAELIDVMQKPMAEQPAPMAEPALVPAAEPLAAAEPALEAAPMAPETAPMANETPSTEAVPVESTSPVPELVEGGQSEFFAPEVIGDKGWTPDEDIAEGEGHVGADHLQKELEFASSMPPEEQEETDQEAVASGI